MAKCMNCHKSVTVGSLPHKSVFKYGGINWVVLDNKGENGVLCLAEKSLFNKAFDDTNCNDWEISTLRKYLNNDLLEEIVLYGATETAFLSMTTDLTADDGLKNYGTCEDLVSLISCNQYRQYRGIIPYLDNEWWTCTPYSPITKVNAFARTVFSDGTLSNLNVCDGYFGVRPLCTLQSETLLSDVKNAENNIKSEIVEIKDRTTITALTAELAIQALKKQILKKVVPLTMHNKKLISGWKCISCEARLWVGCIYCPNCGQKLDWDTGEK